MNLFYRVNYYLLNADSIIIYSFPNKKKKHLLVLEAQKTYAYE
jgi:hypothetical protein